MVQNIILNKSNIVENSNNSKFEYKFPTTQHFKDMQIALGNLSYNNSIFNITTDYNNNFFQYQWYGAGAIPVSNVTIPNGIYTLEELNAYLQYVMLNNGHYLVDSNGDYVWYLALTVNRTAYGYEITSDPIPTALPLGWTNPAGMTFPAVATTPQIILPATNIRTLLGFPAGTYPPAVQATTFNIKSPNIPIIHPVYNVLIACSLVANDLQYPNQVMYSYQNLRNVAGGLPVSIVPPEYAFIDLQDGYYHSLTIQLLDQDFNPIAVYDPNILFNLLLCKRCTIPFKSSLMM